ncbi:MopE-related protein [Flavobacterium sp.]|uniref:MopE-related protein n=1 Tax=Flavobacterium sp. TaxID=239 RepID=UPI00122AD6E0|nr:MopE-related protein [Flavobacterium sp.]RZJ73516.1 MAG: T9SS type A sorting domain-containing protein [Flavobacterium sp.]
MKKVVLFFLLMTTWAHWSQAPLYSNVIVSTTGNGTIGLSNASKNVAVAPNGDIYAVYTNTSGGGAYLVKSTDRGQSYQFVVSFSLVSQEANIHIAQNGTIYVTSQSGYFYRSSGSDTNFTAFNLNYTASSQIASYQDKVYVFSLDGQKLWRNNANGAGTWQVTNLSPFLAFTDIFVDSSDGTIYAIGDDPNIYLRKSTDGGVTFANQTLSPPIQVFYSSYAYSSGSQGKFIFVGGDSATPGYRINLATNTTTAIPLMATTGSYGRTLLADEFGNFVDGYATATGVAYRISNNQGATWQTPINLGTGTGLNIARNHVYQDIIAAFNFNNRVYSTVHGSILPGGTITTSNPSLSTYCQGSTFSLPYAITGSFATGNSFTAQMSDASGSFASPVAVGTATATTSGSINVTIPSSTAVGNGYRFRVISSNPSIVGTSTATNISINALPTATQPANLQACASSTFATFYLPQQTPLILNGQSASQFTVSYHTNLNGANNNTNVISNASSFSAANATTVYARVRNNASASCYAVTSFQLLIAPEPAVDTPDDVISCGPYTLPSLTNGNYFSELNGEGTPFYGGDILTESTTLYIFNHPDPNGCSATSEFEIAILPGQTFYADVDSDGFGDANNSVFSCSGSPQGYVSDNTDCDDSQILYLDADGDGYGIGVIAACGASVNTDCDDSNIHIWQSATLYVDADGDGYSTNATAQVCYGATIPPGYVSAATEFDCNDALAAVHPNAAEIPFNGIDDDCDGAIDEGSQIFSQVLPNQCGTTLSSISSYVGAVSFSAPVDGYRFRVVNVATNAVQVIDRNVPNFQISQLPNFDYAATYSISVQLKRNGQWLNYYGTACQVSTPAILDLGGSAAVSPSQCGITLATISTLIATTSLPNVSAYKFRITDTATNQQQELERSTNWFSLTMLNSYLYGRTYAIEVSVKTNGQFSGYGQPCLVNSPVVPQIANCGATIASNGTLVSTSSLNRVTSYRFELTNMSTFQVSSIDRSQHYFSFNNVPGFLAGAQYAVRVSVMTAGAWSDFSEACFITAPGASRTIVKGEETIPHVNFTAVVYPNPYNESFAFDMDSPSQEIVSVKIYDMIGKLVEQKDVNFDAVETQQFGESYPSGVYNVILAQGGFVKTLRVIKR